MLTHLTAHRQSLHHLILSPCPANHTAGAGILRPCDLSMKMARLTLSRASQAAFVFYAIRCQVLIGRHVQSPHTTGAAVDVNYELLIGCKEPSMMDCINTSFNPNVQYIPGTLSTLYSKAAGTVTHLPPLFNCITMMPPLTQDTGLAKELHPEVFVAAL